MNSIDDTTVVTSTDTWNLSSSESISSDFSQPTVKLRVNEEPKNRKIEQDFERIFNANDNDPFIETLGKDGCYLVEKTGRTAQRTRASIKNSYRYNEKIDPMCQSERSMINENPWLNYSNQRKKCYERNANRKLNKRHSCNVESSRKSWDKLEFKETAKRYSAGDYLRQQILEDLNSNEIIGKTDQQIAEDRCKRIKAYLRRRNDDFQYVSPETRLKELRDWSKFDEHEKDSSVKANRRKDLDRIRSFLQEKIRMRMNEEKRQISEIEKSSADYENELSIRDIRTRYLDYGRVNESGNYPTRRVRSDVNIRLKPSSSDSEKDYDIVPFGNRKGSRKKGNVCRRTRSDIVPEMVIDLEDNEVKKRFHSYSGWKTKNGLIVEKTLGLPNKMAMNLDHESDNRSIDCKQNDDELSIQDIRTRYLDYCRVNESGNYPTRRVRSDVNIRLKPSSSDSEEDCDIVPFGNRKGSRMKRNVCRRTRSDIVPEMVIDLEDNEVKKRFHSYSGWKTKNGLIVEKTLELPNKMATNLDRENDNQSIDYKQNDWQYRNFVDKRNNDVRFDKKFKKYCRRTRSDIMTNKLIERTTFGRTAKQRSISCSDKRKLHWKTSDGSSDLMDSSGFDFEINSTNLRRIRNQQKSSLYSWREYKEKRRQDEMRKELADAEGHQNFTKLCSIPAAWKDFQKSFSSPNESQLLMNIENTKKLKDQKSSDRSDIYLFANDDKADDETNTNESSIKFSRCIGVDNANDTETETILQENYLLLEREVNERDENDRSPTISRLQVNEYRNEGDSVPHESKTSDIGYHSIIINRKSGERCNRIEFNTNSNVKKSDTFKIVDGSENTMVELCDKSKFSWPSNDSKCLSLGNEIIRSCKKTAETTVTSRHSKDDDSRIVTVAAATDDDDDDDTLALSNKDIATDYFRRVYELLKQRQEDARRETPEVLTPTRYDSDTSSTNFDEHEEEVRKRRRRRKKDKNYQGEDPVVVSPGMRTGDNGWKVQRLLVNNDPENIIFRRPQLQNVTGFKRPRHPAPPIPTNCKINAKDISKYFDYPNKENSPRNGVNENRQSDRNESIEEQRQRVDSNEKEMGSNLSRHNGKGLTGRRTQSSGNLCDPKGKLNHVGKILVPCSSTQRETYKICGSLPNHLDDKEILYNDDPRENNNVISDNIVGNFGGSLPHKKRSLGVHFSDTDPTDTLDLVKHRSQDSLEGDPWRYQEGVDLDLVRCKHGNLDVVRKNHSIDVMDDDSSGKTCGTIGRSSDGKCHHGADLDLVGTLPKIRAGETKGAGLSESLEARPNRSVDRTDGESLIKAMHKPDCELMKHHRFDRVVDLKLSRLASGEPQDQGYASERSPEEEHPPSLPGQAFPKVTPENTFRVTLQKSSRGLGLSVSGGATAGPVRVKRLFPQQPAALSKKLQSGDILLAANGVSLTGLTNYEALEVLRTTPSTVELVVCRVPGDTTVTSPGAPPPPPARRELSLRILNPLPPLQIEPCGEFDIEMTKVAGSLGFTLRKVDSSALGHYVRALVREPALSDGRIQPGDKIVSVDGAPLSPMSHEEAVALLRQCGPRVKLRLYRDMAQTPVSALSPTEPDHPLRPPRTSLRQEAVDMLCDLAVRKLSPGTSNGSNSRQTSAASCHSPRRLRKPLSRTPTAENNHENHLTFHLVHPPTTSQPDASDIDQCSINTHASNSQSETPSNDIIDPPPLYDVCDSSDSSKALSRPSFLDLSVQPEKPHFQFSLESESDNTGPIIVTESDSNLTGECDYDDDLGKKAPALSSDEHDNNLPLEPASMPPLLSASRTTSGAFSYKNPAYQSANPTCGGIDNSTKNKTAHSSDQDIPGKILGGEDPAGSKGLLKWKGVMFAPDDGIEETNGKVDTEEAGKESTTEFATLNAVSEDGNEVFTVELTRGWNSRLGFSLQPEGNSTVISVVHPDSVAAKDGRLKEGDVLIMVNDESVENMLTAEIIDLLRKIRGSIGITVMRKNKTKNAS